MGYKVGIDKQQLTLSAMCPDDYIPENHICRVICAFTQQLGMVELGFKYAESKETGCPAFDPRMMLDLYIYGYLHRVRSSRRLEAETHRNIEVMWLMDGLTPDDKTICNFRKDNAKAIRKVFREFNSLCKGLDLFGNVMATDGTKVRANNSRKNNHNKTTVERELSRLDKKTSEYLNALDNADAEEAKETIPSAEQIQKALEKLNARKEKFEELNRRLETESEVSTVDADSRLMRQGGDSRPLDVCYNVQTITEGKHHLIVDFDITDRSDDKGNLENMSKRAMEVLDVENITNLADKGYYDGKDIAVCEEMGVTSLVAKPKAGGAKKQDGFKREDFTYDNKKDCYVCPCQNELRFMRIQKHSDGKDYRVYANYSACSKCPQKSACTKSSYRQILRLPYQNILDVVDERTQKGSALYQRRQEIVEHPFGTIKAVWGYKQFLCRGKEKVTAEMSMACLAYNFRRLFNIYSENVDKLQKLMVG